ncbi:MAG: c-type cytochrome [Acidobacteriota bacterium]
MIIPHAVRIGGLVIAATAFYTYVGQMVPQNEVQPPEEIAIRADLTTPEMVEIGRDISQGKGLCRTCHTIGQTGALRFPDLDGVAARAASRIEGLSDVEYFAQSLYEPDVFIVEGFNPGMPAINRPPIGLTDQEILCVIAYLQSLGGTPTVTLQTAHRYFTPAGTPGGAPGSAAPATPGNATGGAPAPTAAPAPGNSTGAAPARATPPVPGNGTAKAPPPAPPAKGADLTPAVPPPHRVTR